MENGHKIRNKVWSSEEPRTFHCSVDQYESMQMAPFPCNFACYCFVIRFVLFDSQANLFLY
jgi:NADH:ubiquinone oxidoreductase subunit 3 (subunit A)